MRMHVIPFKNGTVQDLLVDNCKKVEIKKHTPANNHKFRDSLKFFIKLPPYIYCKITNCYVLRKIPNIYKLRLLLLFMLKGYILSRNSKFY
jgi:hypothetical protein